MSKPAKESPSVAPETTVPSTSGVSSTPELEQRLLRLNVNDHVEKKQGLTYLSWAWAWAEALKIDPTATFNVQTFDGKPYMDVNGTGMVWVTVSFGGRIRECFLPVMDHRNKPIQNPDAFQVNTAIMRCMTKCLALFGLGLYIYAGEDLPQTDEAEPPKEEPKKVEPKVDQKQIDRFVLTANTMLEYLSIQKTEADLRSYWKSNQEFLDEIKAALPDLYEIVREKFKEAKEKVNG